MEILGANIAGSTNMLAKAKRDLDNSKQWTKSAKEKLDKAEVKLNSDFNELLR